MSERPSNFRPRQIAPLARAEWRDDARPTNYDGGRTAILARRIIKLLDALDEAEADLAQAWADGYNHAKVEMLSTEIGERAECPTCSGRGVWMDEPCTDCAHFLCYPCARGDHDEHKLAWVPDIPCECRRCQSPRSAQPREDQTARMSLPKSYPLRCASCGDRATTTTILEGFRTPVCLRHHNVWWTPNFREDR